MPESKVSKTSPSAGHYALAQATSSYLHNIVHVATEITEILGMPARLRGAGEIWLARGSCQVLRQNLAPLAGRSFDLNVLQWPGVNPGSLMGMFTRQMKRIAKVMDDAARRIETALARKRKPNAQAIKDLQEAANRLRQSAAPYGPDPHVLDFTPPPPGGGKTKKPQAGQTAVADQADPPAENRCPSRKKTELAARILNRTDKNVRPREVEKKLKDCKIRDEGNGKWSIILDPRFLSEGEIDRLTVEEWPPATKL